MLADLRLTLRSLAKSPGFAAISILTLALGIGLNTSMFSLMNLLLLQPLPYPEKDNLVRVYATTPQSQNANHTAPDSTDLARAASEFIDLAVYRQWGYTLKQPDRPAVNLNALRVSANFFPVIGLKPEVGRLFSADEDRPGNHVIVLSHAAWLAHFGGDPAAVGQTVRIDGEPTTIVGVMPETFSSLFLWGPGDAFRPLALTDDEKLDRNNRGQQIVGRHRPGLSLAQLNLRLKTVAERLAQTRPRENSQDGLRAVTLESSARNATTTQIVSLVLGLAGFVLLIACANLANLQLARAVARTHEFAICAALGASRSRLIRPLLVESLLLALAGGTAGILVALWSNDWISGRMTANASGFAVFRLALDWKVLGFALGISLVTGLVFGLVPAWLMSRVRVNDSLKSGGRGSTGDRAQHRFRHALIVAQFALALVLLAGAGFFIRGLDKMLARDMGWNSHGVLQAVLNLPQAKYSSPEKTYAFYTQLQERLGALPGVEKVGVGWTIPVFQFLTSRNYVVEGRDPPPAGREPLAFVNGMTPTFLDTLGVKVTAGRNFSERDHAGAPPVVIIDDSLARVLFPGENPVGRRIGGVDPANRGWAEIVGVVPDLRFAVSIAAPATRFQVFRPLAQETWNYVTVVVRAPAPETLLEPMRRTIGEMDPDLPVQFLRTVDNMIEQGTAGMSMTNIILVAFALLGLFLAALGLYGVIARLVVQRTPEIGVRMALGAQSRDVAWLILGSGLRLIAAGTALGLLGAFGLAQLLALIAPEMPAQGPWAVIAVTLLLLLVALVACWLPARRATKVDPLVALRAE
ncbi:MAG: ABC transporter permease [Opitutaceae bacterium]